MSKPEPSPRRVLLAGATGLIGSHVMEAVRDQEWVRLFALTRREAPMPPGVRMEMLVADPAGWGEAVAAVAPDAVICALGTTMRQAGSEEAFRAVDYDLVLALAQAAKAAGVSNFALVSSVGATIHSKALYLRVKAEIEVAVAKLRIRRLDILRPGLLRGERGNERRPLERLAMAASPLADMLLRGSRRKFRSVDAGVVAAAALQYSREKAQGKFIHENDSILRAARRFEGLA